MILTPHPGEMSRLAGLATQEIQDDRFAVATKLAKDRVPDLVKSISTAGGDVYNATEVEESINHMTDALGDAGEVRGLRCQRMALDAIDYAGFAARKAAAAREGRLVGLRRPGRPADGHRVHAADAGPVGRAGQHGGAQLVSARLARRI